MDLDKPAGKKRQRRPLVSMLSVLPAAGAMETTPMRGESYVHKMKRKGRSASGKRAVVLAVRARKDRGDRIGVASVTSTTEEGSGATEGGSGATVVKLVHSPTTAKTGKEEGSSRTKTSDEVEYVDVELSDDDFVDYRKKLRFKIQLE